MEFLKISNKKEPKDFRWIISFVFPAKIPYESFIGFPMDSRWITHYGFPMGFLTISLKFIVDFQLISYGFPMGLLWVS